MYLYLFLAYNDYHLSIFNDPVLMLTLAVDAEVTCQSSVCECTNANGYFDNANNPVDGCLARCELTL